MPLYWPASGLALAVVVLRGLRWSLLLLVASALVNLWLAPVPASFLPYALLAPFLGVLVGGWLSRRDESLRPGTVRHGFQVLLAGTAMSVVSGLIGGYGLWNAHILALPSLAAVQVR